MSVEELVGQLDALPAKDRLQILQHLADDLSCEPEMQGLFVSGFIPMFGSREFPEALVAFERFRREGCETV